ncbi:hypothetical protein BpHYR1_000502 [Brachionus plicatilis]|uniref:Uncharacterized protein n=1 Tax=Brachionus plicatilis TaxID=10195 RepID=A0A3M7R1B7_BRAPC|nr:hypothetical protein BpHYR1_000502 [Brachionus plicatilis]
MNVSGVINDKVAITQWSRIFDTRFSFFHQSDSHLSTALTYHSTQKYWVVKNLLNFICYFRRVLKSSL